MAEWPLLSLVTFVPLAGAAIIFLIARGPAEVVARNARNMALWTSLVTFVLSLFLWFNFDRSSAAFQFVERVEWFPAARIRYQMGVDGISMMFVLLSTLLTPICVLASWESIRTRVKEYMIAFLILETMMVGMFCALDFLLFYVFFEGVLIPMFIIIGVWGSGERRIYAAFKFFLYTLLGSVLMLLALLYMYLHAGTTDILVLLGQEPGPSGTIVHFARDAQTWLWLAFMASFAVKVPMWPVHTWLPDAHVEAPTAGSVILAGVLLKMGGYGFLRFSIPMLPEATVTFTPLIYTLSVVAVIYTSLVAFAQEDMKKLIAYSSVAHMGYVTIGMFTLTVQGVQGSIFQMLSHGIVSAALFLCVGVVYERLHTRLIARYGGLMNNMPKYGLIFMVFTLASVGLPGTSGFIGEFLSLLGAFRVNTWVAALAAIGVILGAVYMLMLVRRVLYGKLVRDDLKGLLDLSPREVAVFAPLIAMVLWMGIYPSSFISVMQPSVDHLLRQHQLALDRAAVATVASAGGAHELTGEPAP